VRSHNHDRLEEGIKIQRLRWAGKQVTFLRTQESVAVDNNAIVRRHLRAEEQPLFVQYLLCTQNLPP
jgi:hypothetical protein